MLSNLSYSVNAVLPIFILVMMGAILNKYGKINANFTELAEWIVFKISLPVMLFLDVAESEISVNFNPRVIFFLVISVTLCFLSVSLLSILFIKDVTKRGAFVQGVCRSNFAILGVPLADIMFGKEGLSTIAVVMPIVIIMFNTYSVIVLSIFSSDSSKRLNKKAVLGILKNIVTNPLIIGVVLGLLVMLTGIKLPSFASKSLSYLSSLTTPLALFSLGANFKFESLRGRIGYALSASIAKTVLLPLIAVTVAALLGFRSTELGTILICFGAPTAVASYIMSKKMGNDHELSAQILLITTLMCILTIFIGIFILKSLALI